jgi:hypothetical protein
MGKGLKRSLSGAVSTHVIIKDLIKVSAVSLTVAGASGVGFGSIAAGDFPQGNILFLGCVAYMTFTGPISGSLSDTWAGDYGVGTTPASDGTITVGDVDIVSSTALAAATAEVSPRTRGVQNDGSLAGVMFDNTDDSLEINLNLLIDDADISADGIIMSCTGEIFISYVVLGND